MRSEHTDMPLARERSSGSRVRFPVRTTLLMLVAATVWLLSMLLSTLGAESRSGIGAIGDGAATCGEIVAKALRRGARPRRGRPRAPRLRRRGSRDPAAGACPRGA